MKQPDYKKPTGETYNIGDPFTDKLGTDNVGSDARLLAQGFYKYVPHEEFNDQTHELGGEIYSETTYTIKIVPLSPERIAELAASTLAGNIQVIDQACRGHIDKSSHWTAGPMIWDKASGGKPKSKAIKEWTEACWLQYFTNKAMLIGGAPFDEAMAVYPSCPYDIGEAFQE